MERETMTEIIFKEESYGIMGAMFEVYKEMGCGFLEPVYQECVELELTDQQIPFIAQVELQLRYKQHQLKSKYIPDAICYGQIVPEQNSVREINDKHHRQCLKLLTAPSKLGI